jgi:hypothetical protein
MMKMRQARARAIGMAVFFFAVMASCIFWSGAAQSADNGTVALYGVVYVKNAGCFSQQGWDQAKGSAAQMKSGMCGVNDGSKAGDWRLPTLDELRIELMYNSAFTNLPSGYPDPCFWTSQEYANGYAQVGSLTHIQGGTSNKNTPNGVLPVRTQK